MKVDLEAAVTLLTVSAGSCPPYLIVSALKAERLLAPKIASEERLSAIQTVSIK